ncbi:class I SAM-dependent methyltransferase [Pseudogulbenkiania subflava]|uniref:Phosphatidylethanolamine N-methyltransferase n=1 Tax=Pseudogulbenkiania subflava DSM 22618 TaxID=1123014 RepID=A0A1Y6B853_9NEIS|nr:methyltransferase domain-containing protein [Pseudogulbenkiania subflava]SME93648.1 phosphatidylethanolamine N-methyltransferase [Pseudogulbenkiania subflava DSM 22618]
MSGEPGRFPRPEGGAGFATRYNRWRYNLYAPVYDRVVAAFFAPRRRRAIALLAPRPDERILLLGAGTGLDLDYLLGCRRLTAIDVSDGMLARLHRRAARLGLEVEASVMDGQRLAFPDACFDAVILHLILAVIPDPVACLREVERVLKPGGRVVVFDKFLADHQRPVWWRAAANQLTRIIATDINRQLGVIVSPTTLHIEHDESAGMGGFFRIVLLRK